ERACGAGGTKWSCSRGITLAFGCQRIGDFATEKNRDGGQIEPQQQDDDATDEAVRAAEVCDVGHVEPEQESREHPDDGAGDGSDEELTLDLALAVGGHDVVGDPE